MSSTNTIAGIPVAVGLLVRDGTVLMGERKPGKIYPLHWEFPGGKLEAGETALEALRRELQEELSVHITDTEEWFFEQATYTNGLTYDITYFVVRAFHGEIINQEFHRVEWFSREGLRTIQHLTGNANILARLEREGIPS